LVVGGWWLVVGGGGWWWWLVVGGGGWWWWLVVGGGGWWLVVSGRLGTTNDEETPGNDRTNYQRRRSSTTNFYVFEAK
jgi:hypothetical protein